MSVFFYPILTAALFYLGSRAKITWWLWSRYSPRFAAFMDCSACTGFWYGGLLAQSLGRLAPTKLDSLGSVTGVTATFLVMFMSLVATPLVAALHHLALEALGSVVPPDDRRDDANGTVWISSEAIDATPSSSPVDGVKAPDGQLDLSLREALNLHGRS